ncbi:MAG TPA: LysR family transcriptional regulator [Alphaproteobacteria bacterium]|nr:LysR family transcriptional regulator [Alphaproteobacteria bacterium]
MENLAGIAAFVKVVATGSFAKAAAALGVSAPAVSKNVQHLERALGVRLLNRTTRRLALTDEGALYYERCRPAIEGLQSAAALLRDARREPRGTLRVSSTVGFGRQCLLPLLPEFTRRYPGIALDLYLDDRFADLVEDRIDVAIRNGRLDDRNIVARRLAPMQLIVCGAPEYFAHHAPPKTPDDLAQHRCINFRLASNGRIFNWEFEKDGNRFNRSVTGSLTVNDAEATCRAALAGMGLAQIGSYQALPHIAAGRLVPVLTDYIARRRGHYVCYLDRHHLPSRIRVFVDFLCGKMRTGDFLYEPPRATRAQRRVVKKRSAARRVTRARS